MTTVVAERTLSAFFHQEVTETMKGMGLKASKHAEYYLVQLLSDFATSDRLCSDPTDPTSCDEPLVMIFKRAMDAPHEQRVQLLKHLGDFALYISGFFSDSLTPKLVDLSYYISMGSSAYRQLSSIMQRHRHGDVFSGLFTEMSKQFVPFVDVLSEISENARPSNNASLLSVYERWLHTKSKRLERKLTDHGVITDPDADTWKVN